MTQMSSRTSRLPWLDVLEEISLQNQMNMKSVSDTSDSHPPTKEQTVSGLYTLQIHSIFPVSNRQFDIEVHIAEKVLSQRLKSVSPEGKSEFEIKNVKFDLGSWGKGEKFEVFVYKRRIETSATS